MPRKPSIDLFLLVKSFSANEWDTFWRIQHQNQRQRPKEEGLPLLHQYILFLRDLDQYDEEAVKQKFQITPNSQRLKKLKIRAEELIQEVIERTPENITPHRYVQKLPSLISEYISRGAIERAEVLIKKYLTVARDWEILEVENQLLSFWEQIHTLKSGNSFEAEIAEIARRRMKIASMMEEVGALRRMLEELKFAAKNGVEASDKLYQSMKRSKLLMRNTKFCSTKGEALALHIRKHLAVFKGDIDQYKLILERIKGLAETFPHRFSSFELLKIHGSAVCNYIDINAREHKTEIAEQQIGRALILAESLPPMSKRYLLEKLRLSQLAVQRMKLDKKGIKRVESDGWKFYKAQGFPLEKRECFLFVYLISEASFATGNHRTALKWLSFLRTSSPSIARPELTALSYLISLCIKLDEMDYEIFKSILNHFIKYVKRHHPLNALFLSWIQFLKKALKSDLHLPQHEYAKFYKEILLYLSQAKYTRLGDYMPMEYYLRSKAEKKTLQEVLMNNRGPFSKL